MNKICRMIFKKSIFNMKSGRAGVVSPVLTIMNNRPSGAVIEIIANVIFAGKFKL